MVIFVALGMCAHVLKNIFFGKCNEGRVIMEPTAILQGASKKVGFVS